MHPFSIEWKKAAAGPAALREGKFLCISQDELTFAGCRAHHLHPANGKHSTHFLNPNLYFATEFGVSELDGEVQKTQFKNSERQTSLLLLYSRAHCKPQKLCATYVVQTNGILFNPHGRHQRAGCPKIPVPSSIFSF